MRFNNVMSAILLAGVFTIISCSQEELGGQPQNNGKNLLQITVTDAGVYNDTPVRAVEDGYATNFEAGDKIGVYGVKDGVVIVENHKFTFKEDGTWEPNGNGIEFVEGDMEETKFYAYYPYQVSGVDFDASVGLKGDPFAQTVNKWTIGTDLDKNYTNSDLMTSKVADITSTGALGKVEFVLNHRMSVAAISLPGKIYNFTNTEPSIEPYKLPAAPGDFKVEQAGEVKTVKPYYDEKNGLYRILVKPNVEYTISGTYTLGKRMEYTTTRTAAESLPGKAVKFNLKGSVEVTHTLQVGDYYCADGSIISKGDKAPDNAIGVVYFVGNPQPSAVYPSKYTEYKDVMKRDFPDCKHGLVVALNDANGGASSMFSKNKALDIDKWKNDSYDEGDRYVNLMSNPILTDMLGYNNTKIMQISQSYEAIQMRSNLMCSVLDSYRMATPAPFLSTDWFCPSFGDFNIIIKNYSTVSANINAAGGLLPQYTEIFSVTWNKIKDSYWTSSIRNTDSQWITGLNVIEEDGKTTGIAACNSSGNVQHFRFCLAF